MYINGTVSGENLNKESMSTATKGFSNYLSNVYGGIVTSVENMQKEGIPVSSKMLFSSLKMFLDLINVIINRLASL